MPDQRERERDLPQQCTPQQQIQEKQQIKKVIDIEKYILWGKICCWFTILYNIGEGISSIVLGEEESSISLVAFGAQSFIETASSVLVIIRFYYFEKHNIKEQMCTTTDDNDEEEQQKSKKFLRVERAVTIAIGAFFVILSLFTAIVSSISLSKRDKPDSTVDNVIISGIGLVATLVFWYAKKRVSKTLNSSALAGDAACNLACIKLTIVLLIGSIVFIFWKDGWWIDSSIAIALALLFTKEGYDMLKWGCSKNFTGGCGDCCENKKKEGSSNNSCEEKRCSTAKNPCPKMMPRQCRDEEEKECVSKNQCLGGDGKCCSRELDQNQKLSCSQKNSEK